MTIIVALCVEDDFSGCTKVVPKIASENRVRYSRNTVTGGEEADGFGENATSTTALSSYRE